MRPDEYLRVAQIFGSPAGPYPQGRQRSAISRSYYSAFLEAREKLEQLPHIRVPRKSAHDAVTKAFLWADADLNKRIGRLLRDLKMMRERADYDLEPDVADGDAAEALRIAQDIQNALAVVDLSKCADPDKGPVAR